MGTTVLVGNKNELEIDEFGVPEDGGIGEICWKLVHMGPWMSERLSNNFLPKDTKAGRSRPLSSQLNAVTPMDVA